MKEILGIDIGATGTKGAIVDIKKGVLITERFKLATPESKKPEAMANAVREICQNFQWKNKMLGIGFPAVIKNKICYTASNIDKSWIGKHMYDLFNNKTKCNSTIINDADAAGIAEMTYGVGKKWHDGIVILLTLGTGIGSALFMNGVLVPNTELGHLKFKGSIAEHFASNSARKNNNLTWAEYGKVLNDYLRHVDFLFSPDLIILGGGISKQYKDFSKYISKNLNVKPALHYNNAGIIGAAMAVSYGKKIKAII
jgi:polyphosphate glucokinase